MSSIDNVLMIWQPLDRHHETQVYGKLNANIDWSVFDKIVSGQMPFSDYQPLQIKMRTNAILNHDLIRCPGCSGLWSQKSVDIIGLEALRNFQTFPVFVNEKPYFAIQAKQVNDCLDVKNSDYTELNIGSGIFLEIKKYAFDCGKISENSIFVIPQTEYFLYCTENIGRKLLENELGVIVQPLLREIEDLRQRVVYDNPFFGISFAEPKNWRLDCKQLKTLKTGKKVAAKSWELAAPESGQNAEILSLQRFQQLKSDDWNDKARITIAIWNASAEAIFEQNNTIIMQNISHPDRHFEVRTNEYQWYRTLITPYKNGLNLVVGITTRNDDPAYLAEAIQVFQNIKFEF